jgi:radical SAM protein with 4Fe4S-binding SPASM domain
MNGDQQSASELIARLGQSRAVSLHVLVSDHCNHSCVHCYQIHGQREELTSEQLVGILQDFRASGGMIVTISGGEATLRHDLLDLLGEAQRLGLVSVLCTNGYSMTADLAAALAALGVWRVEVSLYSHLPGEHDSVTRVPGSFESTTEGIRALRAARVNVRLKVTPLDGSSSSLTDLQRLAEELDCSLIVATQLLPKEDGAADPLHLRQDPSRLADLARDRPRVDKNDFVDRAPCGAGSAALTVRADGAVLACTVLGVELARATDDKWLDRSWGDEVAQFFRNATWADLHGCRDCDLVPYCVRCYATAAAEGGDMLGPYAGACSLAVAKYENATGAGRVLSLEPGCGPGRAPGVGPYRTEAGGLRPIPDVMTVEDHDRARKYPWTRLGTLTATNALPSLVRLRRSRVGDPLDGGPATA